MKTVHISLVNQSGAWRLTFDGKVLGDQHGYTKAEALAEAKRQAAVTDDGRWSGSTWIEIKYVLDI